MKTLILYLLLIWAVLISATQYYMNEAIHQQNVVLMGLIQVELQKSIQTF